MPSRPDYPEVYSRLLYSKNDGYPLFHPAPALNEDPVSHEQYVDHVQIGSAGFVSPEGIWQTGSKLNADEIAQCGRVMTVQNYMPPNLARPLCEEARQGYSLNATLGVGGDPAALPIVPVGGGFSLSISSRVDEAAILAIPPTGEQCMGADLRRLASQDKMKILLLTDDGRRLRQCMQDQEAEYGPGPLIVVTGHIKSRSSGTAAIRQESSSLGGCVSFTALGAEASIGGSKGWQWSSNGLAAACWHTCEQLTSESPQQCLFVQGLRISRRPRARFWPRNRSTELIHTTQDTYHSLTPDSSRASSWTRGSSSASSSSSSPGESPTLSARQSSNSLWALPWYSRPPKAAYPEFDSISCPSDSDLDSDSDSDSDIHTPQYEPQMCQQAHPLDVLNNFILANCPEAEFAMTHDHDLAMLLGDHDDDDTVFIALQDLRLEQLLGCFNMEVHSGIAHLSAKIGSQSRLIQCATARKPVSGTVPSILRAIDDYLTDRGAPVGSDGDAMPFKWGDMARWATKGMNIIEKSTESEHHCTAQLLDLVVLPESGDYPDASLRAEDGLSHTGDLFREDLPVLHASRERNDDWIKMDNSLRCDTKAIEDNVRLQCKRIVEDCIVVGNGRPSPALFIEVADSSLDHTKVKREVIRRIRPFHNRLYLHERIADVRMIIVVPSKTLPRTATKGNIRRKEVEATYKQTLDTLYTAIRV